MRTAADLPWQSIPVRLGLHVRRFFCDHPVCGQRTFTERLPGVVAPYARRTARLDDWLTGPGFAIGGEPGGRLLEDLGVAISEDTLLTQIRVVGLGSRPARHQILGRTGLARGEHVVIPRHREA